MFIHFQSHSIKLNSITQFVKLQNNMESIEDLVIQ